MLSPKAKQYLKPNSNQAATGGAQTFKPHPHHHLNSFSQKKSELKQESPDSRVSNSPFEKHERSMNSLYSKYMQHKTYEDHHQLGYSADQIKKAVEFLFGKYDSNHDNLLDKQEVKKMIQNSLLHMGHKHTPSQLEIVEFILAMDKNNDGKLSRDQLEKAFKRANRIDY